MTDNARATTQLAAGPTTAPAATKAVAKKTVPAKTVAKKTVAKKTVPAKTTAAGKAPAKKTPAAKAAPRSGAAKTSTNLTTDARKTTTRKAPARKATAREVPAAHVRNASSLAGGVRSGGSDTPHRPSRRHLIVEAAVRVFARKGFSEASIQEIADEAGVVATAVYYHFAGKEELFEAALSMGLDASDAVIAAARPDDAPANASIFRSVIRASWDWAAANPDMARLLFLHMPGGATPGARALAREYLDRHARRAYDYFESKAIPTSRSRAAAEYAARTLSVRTVMGLTLSVHSLQMDGGPLSTVSSSDMVDATAELSERIFRGN